MNKVNDEIKVEWQKWKIILKLSDQSDIFESTVTTISKLS
jgi:hypothetical protein